MKGIGTLFIIVLFTLFSCRSPYPNDGQIVARVGNNVLLKSEVEYLVPPGISYDDSIAMVQQYVNSWSLKYLLIAKAEKEIPGVHGSIEREINDYRNSLLAYRYEKQYIDQRLDTLVTENEERQYYFDNQENFTSTNSVVTARVIKISSSSPNLARIKSLYRTESIDDVAELERICYNSADKYTNFDNRWVDLAAVAGEIPFDITEVEKQIKLRNYIETTDALYNYLVFFSEIINPEHIAPFEFYQQRIKEIIIGKRKQELIEKLERDLMKEALDNNTLVTTINK